MTKIVLEGMHFYAYHGFYAEERKIGNHFKVDVEIDARTQNASDHDDLTGTINYETVYTICRFEMRKSSQLLEHLAQRICQKITDQFPHAQSVLVRLTKQTPPLGGVVDRAFVEVRKSKEDDENLFNFPDL